MGKGNKAKGSSSSSSGSNKKAKLEPKKEIEFKEEMDKDFEKDLLALQKPTDSTTSTDNKSSQVSSTLFIRNLPFDATNEELTEFFEEIGPIKSCFVVSNKDGESAKKKNKGIGFVNFALKEDATRAMETLKDTLFKSKALTMEYANRKPTKKEEAEARSKAKAEEEEGIEVEQVEIEPSFKSKPQHHNLAPKSDANENDRTVAITNLPSSIGKARLHKIMAEHNIKPMEIVSKPGYARMLYETVELAQLACSRIQNKVVDKITLRALILSNHLHNTRHSRIIVRNLPFKFTARQLEKLFDAHGAVLHTTIPSKGENSGLQLGFGFVQYSNPAEASKAIEHLNETVLLGRKITVAPCLSKALFEKEVERHKGESKQTQFETVSGSDEESGDDDTEVKQEDEEEDFKNALYEEGEPDADDSDKEESEEESEEASEAEELTKSKKSEGRSKQVIPPGCTLFIRNLLFETTDQDLFDKFSEFGKLRYARVVYDKVTQRSKGTGFVAFVDPNEAKKCLELSFQLGYADVDAKAAKNGKSVLTKEGPSDLVEKFTLQDRSLIVSMAVDRDEAQTLAAKDPKVDRRNYYLLREGLVTANSELGKLLNPKEVEKRQTSFNLRKKQLDANPSLYLSQTRLSLRNLPLHVDDTALKRLGLDAVNQFKAQVRSKLRSPLSKEEMALGWDKKPLVTQAKVVLSKDRIDPLTQKPRSQGFGFLEFNHHAHALAVLRYLNCNPDAFPKSTTTPTEEVPKAKTKANSKSGVKDSGETIGGKLLDVSFAVENKLILKKREVKVNRQTRKFEEKKEDLKKEETLKKEAFEKKKQSMTFVHKKHNKKHKHK